MARALRWPPDRSRHLGPRRRDIHAADNVSSSSRQRYVDSAGWSIAYPQSLQIERSVWTGRYALSQVTVASFAMRPAVGPTGNVAPPLDADGRFPDGSVAFRMLLQAGRPGQLSLTLDDAESRFPIALDSFEASEEQNETAPPSIWRSILANGNSWRARAWIAHDAPRTLRSQLADVVASLTFPALSPGAITGIGFMVLEDQDAYPIGSFTAVRAGGLPLLLVHAPGGFYALGWNWSGPPDTYRATCDHHVDTQRDEIYCAACEARWDRIGRVITRPTTAPHDEPLHLSTAKVASDGHVLVHPHTFQAGSAPNARRFWPGWDEGH